MLGTKEGRWQKATGRMPEPRETDGGGPGFVMIDDANRGRGEYSLEMTRVDRA
jgi:hypothetical protein